MLDVQRQPGLAGTAAIEFGLAIPFLLIMLMGLVEVGFGMYEAMQVYSAVEAGALYAAKNGFDATAIANAVVNATATPGLTASPAPVQFCGCPACERASLPRRAARPAAAAAPRAPMCASARRWPHDTILPYPGLLPTTLTAQSVVRLN